MNVMTHALIRIGRLGDEAEYHLVRASLVVIFLFFGYQKWFEYEAQALIPYSSHGPLLFWMYPVFGIRGATWVLGVAEWSFAILLFLGFWHKRLGALGALGSCAAFIGTVTIIPFLPDGWEASAGGFPAMTRNVSFLMKHIVLSAAPFPLLKQDAARVAAWMPQADLVTVRGAERGEASGLGETLSQPTQRRGVSVGPRPGD